MSSNELSLMWQQVEALRLTVADMVDLQRQTLSALQTTGQDAPSATLDPILSQLDTLGERLQQQGQEMEKDAERVSQGHPVHFDEISTERINVVEEDGTLRMAISNKERAPDPVMDGQVISQRMDGNMAGIIFYNDEGDECQVTIRKGHQRHLEIPVIGTANRRAIILAPLESGLPARLEQGDVDAAWPPLHGNWLSPSRTR